MYRLGQSSLPTEGTGPVVNLLTREVNDVRDGLFAELDHSWRMPVLALGLVAIVLFLSPTLTLFLASLGGLIWFTSRYMTRDSRLVSDAAMRDASVQLCLLHEDLGLLRTVRVYGMENVDKQRFDEHLERFREADARRIKTEGRLNPTTGLLYGFATIVAIGLLGYSVVVTHRISPASALVLVVSLAGLIHPWLEWLAMRRSIRQANRSAAGLAEFLERKPELHQQGGAQFLQPIKDRITLRERHAREPLGPRPARRRLGRVPRRHADRDHGPRRGRQARDGLPDPPPDRPQGRPRPDRRPRPPRGDARIDPGPGRAPCSRPTSSSPTRSR